MPSSKDTSNSALFSPDGRVIIVVMGVSGSGKTTLGRGLAEALSFPFIDADDLHSEANKDKMSRGEPLTDADRAPWLVGVRGAALEAVENSAGGVVSGPGVIVACSALKASYRDVLRGKQAEFDLNTNPLDGMGTAGANGEKGDGQLRVDGKQGGGPRTYFVHPVGPRCILMERMTRRESHFMKADMVESQFDTLEDPGGSCENGIVEIGLDGGREEQVWAAIEGIRGCEEQERAG